MTFDDEKYKSLRDTLKTSARLKAKGDFETRLFERIREAEKASLLQTDALRHHPQVVKLAEPKRKFTEILSSLFRPAFVPALGLSVVLLVAVVVYFGYFNKMGDMESDSAPLSNYQAPGDLIIYVKGDAADSFSSNYPREYSAVDQDVTDDIRSLNPTEVPSDYFAQPETETLPEPTRLDKVSEEQKIEMEKGYDGIDVKSERKTDGIMKKESKIAPKKDSKSEGKMEKSPFNIREEDAIKNSDSEDESGKVNQQIAPDIKANEQTQDTIEKQENKSRISRAVKDSSKTNTEADDSNETIQQK